MSKFVCQQGRRPLSFHTCVSSTFPHHGKTGNPGGHLGPPLPLAPTLSTPCTHLCKLCRSHSLSEPCSGLLMKPPLSFSCSTSLREETASGSFLRRALVGVPLCSESLWASRAGAAAHKPHEAKPGPLARLAAPLLPCPVTPPQPRCPPSDFHSGTALGLESAPFLSQTKGHFSNMPCLPPRLFISLVIIFGALPIYNY